MEIFCFTDLHDDINLLKKIIRTLKRKKPEFILCAGDLSFFENELDLGLFLLHTSDLPVYIIHGNHEGVNVMKKMCKPYKNIHFIHRTIVDIGEYTIVGWGGGGFSEKDKSFEKWTKRISNRFRKRKLILLNHGPPYGTKLDKLDVHVGNKSYSTFIKRFKPKLVVCGHLHENEKKKDKIKSTRIINPGPKGMFLRI